MSKSNIRINISPIFKTFDEHITLENNNRILFSAPFGTGKTTFLDEFFTPKEEQYNVIKLYPVNYSVSQNEDVFELIKFDLLFELVTKYKVSDNEEKYNYSFALIFQMFLLNNIDYKSLLPVFIKQFGKIGKASVEVYEELKRQYEVYKDEILEDDNDKISNFISETETKTGSPYELDPISALIQNHIQNLATDSKKNVLIIDDLDRLDPEHIFRLFNVFSVHFNQHYETNKFGFDKIIFVCDINNIKNIYHHKYGNNVDFVGYIDKFYSYFPFEFDNSQFIKAVLREIMLNNIQINLGNRYSLKSRNYEHSRFVVCLRSIVISLINSKKANLRMLIYAKSIELNNDNSEQYYFNFNNIRSSALTDFEIIIVFYVLKSMYGSFDNVENVLSELSKIYSIHRLTDRISTEYVDSVGAYREVISYCLPFHLSYKKGQRGAELIHTEYTNEIYTCKLHKFDLYAHFKEFSDNNYYEYRYNFQKFTKDENQQSEEVFLNPYEFLYETFKICNERGAFYN